LITAQVSLFSAESAGLVNPLTQTDLNLLSRRPYLRKSTIAAVQATANKTVVNGQEFYVSATDIHVLIPVSGKYDDPAIMKLPKDDRGWYYLGPNGIKYPVNSKVVMGHRYGEENWRLRNQALRADPPMTWKQYTDFYNDPSHWRIEDYPGNASHKDEMPR
jgi:hypothetical protein